MVRKVRTLGQLSAKQLRHVAFLRNVTIYVQGGTRRTRNKAELIHAIKKAGRGTGPSMEECVNIAKHF